MKVITAMTECPKGSNHKLDYDPQTNRFKLSKILPAGLSFPFDFGSIPGTKGEDGDPLDIIIISETTSFPGCLIDCRIIGGIQALQTERDGKTVRNDRFIGIPEVSQLYAEVDELEQLSENILNQLEAFFKNYNKQAGKQFEVLARLDAAAAYRLIDS
ncbi:inorganic diphosphatase [Mucilaginibacter boryungensis]|uniref:inorganic diphosphatase n=1 Tax=Mucilaginibacter boryungensis TaxID=768480 RepID=A0ABR9XCW8_9SPHI|nr:inorganic diphosphatase [Mucilaginibacter boryungensis]MBE9664918.1 inorganic diphosphatase [Mucilaginibacter boryungensis]